LRDKNHSPGEMAGAFSQLQLSSATGQDKLLAAPDGENGRANIRIDRDAAHRPQIDAIPRPQAGLPGRRIGNLAKLPLNIENQAVVISGQSERSERPNQTVKVGDDHRQAVNGKRYQDKSPKETAAVIGPPLPGQ